MNTTETVRIQHLIILDESSSMWPMAESAKEGCRKTIANIRSLQKEGGDREEHSISIYAFQSGGVQQSRYLIKNQSIHAFEDALINGYNPAGCTPLYDAIGSTLVDLLATVCGEDDSTAFVTIITDGCENTSTVYTHSAVVELIEKCRNLGWTINFIGANVDAAAEAAKLHIDNSLQMEATAEGVEKSLDKLSRCMAPAMESYRETFDPNMPKEERRAYRVSKSKSFFSRDEKNSSEKLG